MIRVDRRLAVCLVVGVVAVAATLGAVGSPALAQDRGVTFQFKDTPLVAALNSLRMAEPGFNFTVVPELADTAITASLDDVPFDVGLRVILESVGATYKLDGGVYRIRKQVAAGPGPAPAGAALAPPHTAPPAPVQAPGAGDTGAGSSEEASDPETVIQLMGTKHIDPADVALLFGGYPIYGEMSLRYGGYGGGGRGGYGGYGGHGGYGRYGGYNGGTFGGGYGRYGVGGYGGHSAFGGRGGLGSYGRGGGLLGSGGSFARRRGLTSAWTAY